MRTDLGDEAYRAIYEFSPDGVLFTAPDGRVLAANPAACAILGRTEAEICALGRQRLVDPADDRWAPMVAERGRTGSIRGVGRMLRGDGTPIEVELSARLFDDATGRPRSCTVFRDVTDRVRIERELLESRARLDEAERIAQMGSWERDLLADRTTCSEGLLRIHGLSREQFDPSFAGAQRRVYPEDRARVVSTLDRAIEQRSSFVLEYRAVRSDGRLRTLRSQGDVVVDDSGTPIRLVGVVQDITEARMAQEALQSTSADLERRAAELQRLVLASTAGPNPASPARLTTRQREILELIAQGLTTGAIAERLVVSDATVKWHVKQILAKTGAANRAEAIARVLGEPRPAN